MVGTACMRNAVISTQRKFIGCRCSKSVEANAGMNELARASVPPVLACAPSQDSILSQKGHADSLPIIIQFYEALTDLLEQNPSKAIWSHLGSVAGLRLSVWYNEINVLTVTTTAYTCGRIIRSADRLRILRVRTASWA